MQGGWKEAVEGLSGGQTSVEGSERGEERLAVSGSQVDGTRKKKHEPGQAAQWECTTDARTRGWSLSVGRKYTHTK